MMKMNPFLLEMFFLFYQIAQIIFADFIIVRAKMLTIYCSAKIPASFCQIARSRSECSFVSHSSRLIPTRYARS